MSGKHLSRDQQQKKVWIDLDNSPHIPFFAPIIEELKRRDYSVLLTARDCFQVVELADLFGLDYRKVGRHYGKHTVLKLAGLGMRTAQLARAIAGEKPDLAISHGSRAQLVVSRLLGIPSIVIVDYEFARGLVLMQPSRVMVPEVIPANAVGFDPKRVLHYPGIKEDVYVPRFVPDPKTRASLGLSASDLVVTVRPPANEAHYHNPEAEELLATVFAVLDADPRVKIVLLPRNHSQESILRNQYPALFASGKAMVPTHAMNGLNLIWYSDLVVSGGGTMNREAAALGVPVYSIFRGKIGAVDRYLAQTKRLILLESSAEVKSKIVLQPWKRPARPANANFGALTTIVDHVSKLLGTPEASKVAAAAAVGA